MQVSGQDRLLITGLGPVGLAAAMLGRALGATTIIGTDLSENRLAAASNLGLVDVAIKADDEALDQILSRTGGHGCEVSIDCSGAAAARLLALQGTRDWGRCAYVGEGGTVSFEVSKVTDPQADHPLRLVGHLASAPGGIASNGSIAGASIPSASARTGFPSPRPPTRTSWRRAGRSARSASFSTTRIRLKENRP